VTGTAVPVVTYQPSASGSDKPGPVI